MISTASKSPAAPPRESDDPTSIRNGGTDAGRNVMLRVDVVTIFPRMFDPLLAEGVLARGIKSDLIRIEVWDLRDFATDRHRSTDDEAYGGGPGMVMLAEPVFRCVDAIRRVDETRLPTVVTTSPQGELFRHQTAQRLQADGWVVFLCGRYEGFDERISSIVDIELSLGDFVVSGGELPAMLMIDAISRLVDGVVGNSDSVAGDSFFNGLLDYPHYTRPAEIRGLKVPEVLISGHAEKIRLWRKEQSLRQTLSRRPDLLATAELDPESKKILEKIKKERAKGEEEE